MSLKIRQFYIPALLLLLFSCQKNVRKPISDSKEKPEGVQHVEVKSLPGALEISYTLPKDKNILYVKASCKIDENTTRETRASYYKNSLVIAGLPDIRPYRVELRVVSRAEVSSEPTEVTASPLEPPVLQVFKTLQLSRTFGGVAVSFQNQYEADIELSVLATDSLGDLIPADNFYTSQPEGVLAARGFDTTQRKFGVYVRDHWDNYSDTVYATLTPIFEKELDKSKFKEVHLPGDNWQAHVATATLSKLWDGIAAVGPSGNRNYFSNDFQPFPQSFTFDLGVTATLSRFIYFPRSSPNFAYTNQPRVFEIWGTDDDNPSADWNDWTMLLHCEVNKPSGPGTQVTDEDLAYFDNGISFEFPPGTPPARYIRFKTIAVWSGSNTAIYELTFFGNDQ